MQLKRFFDFSCAFCGILILLPILLIIAILIKISSKGSVLFQQQRVGLNGKLFSIYKFRTMINNAENLGPKITVGRDQRITRVGVFLRKTKLDELPQLINVLKGDMTIVGPRPEVPEYVALYPEKIKNIVLAIRPGITDYASLLMIDESTILARSLEPKLTYINEIMPQKLDLAVKYIQERSFIIDLKIIFLTLFKIVKRS